jgi:hypothetical protein
MRPPKSFFIAPQHAAHCTPQIGTRQTSFPEEPKRKPQGGNLSAAVSELLN